MSLALADGFSTTEPPGKSQDVCFYHSVSSGLISSLFFTVFQTPAAQLPLMVTGGSFKEFKTDRSLIPYLLPESWEGAGRKGIGRISISQHCLQRINQLFDSR